MSWNDLYSFRASLPIGDIDRLRQGIRQNISELSLKKGQIPPNDYNLLMNHLNYILDLYNNMINRKKVEQSDPYSQTSSSYLQNKIQGTPNAGKQTVIYNPDGTTKLVSQGDLCVTNEGWEAQFDSSLLINPPSYSFPPMNKYRIDQIKNMTQPQRLE